MEELVMKVGWFVVAFAFCVMGAYALTAFMLFSQIKLTEGGVIMRFRVVRQVRGVFSPIFDWTEVTPLTLEVERQRVKARGEFIQYKYADGEIVTLVYRDI